MTDDAAAADRSLRARADRYRSVPSRFAATERAVEELRDHLLATRHLASVTADWRAEVDGVLNHLSEMVHRLHHEVVGPIGGDDDSTLARRLDAQSERVVGVLGVVQRALQAPARDEAYAALIAELGPPPDPEPGLSVLVAAWNHATRLDAAIESALAVVPPERVIVLDDASTDDTAEVLGARAESIRVIRPPANLGLTRARNALLHATATRHVAFLDADNRLLPEFADLVEVAERWEASAVHGVLLEVDADDRATGLLGATALNGDFFSLTHNLVDTLAVLDAEAVRRAGGYTLDPLLETSEDWDMWHRLAQAGGLLVHTPVVVGRKLRVASGHNSQPQDRSAQFAAIDRTYRFDGRLNDRTVASAVIHPATGPLWASAAAVDLRPELGEALPEPHHDAFLPEQEPLPPARPAVLVVGGGGVSNLGDDATAARLVGRVAAIVGDDVEIEVITDGPAPLPGLAPGLWLGTLDEHADRVLDHHVAVVIGGGGTLADPFAKQVLDRVAIVEQARRANVPVLLTGQGIGPVDHLGADVATVVRGAAVSCRDERSAELARQLGATDVTVVGDDAADGSPPTVDQLPDAVRPLAAHGWVAFHARLAGYSGADDDTLGAAADLVDQAAAELGLPVVAVAINRQPPPESDVLGALAAEPRRAPWLVVDVTDDPAAARALFGLARAALVHSFHAAWFCLEQGTPAVVTASGAYYDGKTRGLAALTDTTGLLDAEPPASPGELLRRWDDLRSALAERPLDGIDRAAHDWLDARLTPLLSEVSEHP